MMGKDNLLPSRGYLRLQEYLLQPVPSYSTIFFRIAFGLIMLWEVLRYFNHGWIKRYWIDPAFYFTYEGFGWLTPWPGDGMYIHFFVLGILALFIAVGICYRASTVLFFLGFTYIFLLDKSNYLNHFYLISLISFLLILIPANRYFSLDALLWPAKKTRYIPRWAVLILRFQIGIVYFYGGVAKINEDWLRGEPMRKWLGNITDFPIVGQFFTEEWAVYLFSYGGLLLDLLIVPFLLWRKTRLWAFAVIGVFHLMNAHLFHIGIFPWFMIAATTIFFKPEWCKEFFRVFEKNRPEGLNFHASSGKWAKLAVVFLAAYVSIQLLVPLRHWLYPGNVSWTEEGHKFAWHMKLRSKSASAKFIVEDPVTGKSWEIKNSNYLRPRQRSKMAARPDMILQFSQYLAEDFRKKGYENVIVRAEVYASLNSRKPKQLLIDPEVNLSAIDYCAFPLPFLCSTNSRTWIKPLEN